MKATIDIPEDIYRQVKAKSALEGRAVREVAIALFRDWVEQPGASVAVEENPLTEKAPVVLPRWFASLQKYAPNAHGRYDMDTIRHSIAHGRAGKEKTS
jgi:hypothetical protein